MKYIHRLAILAICPKFTALSSKLLVLSSQFLVLISPKFAALSSKFLVLSSKFLVLSLKFLVLSSPSFASHYCYRQIAVDELAGLPSTIKCIYADRQGYLWFGTKSGLGRFDGNELRSILHDDNNPLSLPGNNIYQILEDADGDLWVMTDAGVTRYDYSESNFYALTVKATSACPYRGGLLLGGESTVSFYDKNLQETRLIAELPTVKGQEIVEMCLVDDCSLICRTRWSGLWTVDLNNGSAQRAPYACGMETTAMLLDSQGRLWVSDYNHGLRLFDKSGALIGEFSAENAKLAGNIVTSLTEHKGRIWAGTDGNGISIIDQQNGTTQNVQHVAGEKYYSLPTNAINCLYSDPFENLWIGGIYNGLISMKEVNIKTYTDLLAGQGRGLSNNIVLSLYPGNDVVFIGTDGGGGLDRFDPKTETFFNYPTTKGMKVVSICGLTSGKLLISAFGDGLYVLDLRTGRADRFIVMNENVDSWLCRHGNSVTVYNNSPASVLIMGDHLYIYDFLQNKFTVAAEEKPGIIYNGTLRAFWHDDDVTYLSDYKHIYEFDHRDQYLKLLFTCNSEMNINAAMSSQEGFFWLGTNMGLVKYDPYRGTVDKIDTPLLTEVTSLLIDKEGKLWIGACNSLVRYSPDTNTFAVYGQSDGAMPNEYLPGAAMTYVGDFYFGGVKGLTHIGRAGETAESDLPVMKLSDLVVNGESQGSSLGPKGRRIEMGSNIKLMFMAKENDMFRQRIYRYWIKGLDTGFTETVKPEVNFAALSSGTYKVLVACTLRDGTWTQAQQIAEIKVFPHWYLSTWFIVLCVVAALAMMVLIIIRMTRRQQMKLQIQAHEMEKEINEKKVRFLINISHELRTPLTLIHAPLKRILKQLPEDDNVRSQLSRVYRQSLRMKDLINMVLDLRKMETGKAELRFETLALNRWIEMVSADYAAECRSRGIEVEYDLDPEVGDAAIDSNKAETVLTNLLINALKHSPQGSQITVASRLSASRDMVRISVADQGSGLKNSDPQLLFTRFYQGDGERHGTGIGLSYSKLLVEMHHGSIGAMNNEDRGATFFFELPLKQVGNTETLEAGTYLSDIVDEGLSLSDNDLAEVKQAEVETKAYTILFVDDNSDMTDFLRDALKDRFKKVLVACNGEKALQLTMDYMPDIVVSDVMMPKMNGYELCRRIKGDLTISHIPVILLTAKSDEQSMKSGYKNGADAYLAKPFDIETLTDVILNRLRNRESLRKKYLAAGAMPMPQETTISHADEAFLSKLNDIISRNIDNTDLDTNFLCKEIGMSRASLFNKMKALTAMGSSEYITRMRMERAIKLIETTDMTFTEISEKVGFASPAYFSTAFKQFTGESPSKFKKRIKAA